MRAHHLLVVLAALGACKKAKEQPPSPTAPTSTGEQDALWALAPEGAIGGMVVAPSALAKIEAGAVEVGKFMSAPDLAPFKAKMDEEISEVLGTPNPTLAAAGLTATKGLAVFAVPGKSPITILPIADRDKFLSVVKGTKGADGTDTIKRATCKTVKNVYACARDAELLDLLGKGKLTDSLSLAGARGEIEFVAVIPEPAMTIAGVAQLSRGAAVVRGAVKGVPPEVKKYLSNTKPRVDGDKTAGFAVANITPLLEEFRSKVPPMPIVEGVKADELFKTITGPITLTVANASTTFDLRVPLTDGGPAGKVLAQCDKLPGADMAQATVKDGVCSVTVAQMNNMKIDTWVDGKTLRMGTKGDQGGGPSSPLSAVAQELANGEWMMAMFGRGTLFGPIALPMPIPAEQLPPEAMLGIRSMAMINEMGFGVKVDGDVVRVLGSVRTAWSNPDDVVAKIVAISPQDILAGKAGPAGKAIADASPKSPFASDYATGYGGLMLPTATIGILAAVAIPAYMDYMKKSKVSEATLQLNKLGKNLKVYYTVNDAFPKGTVGPSPAKSCCEFDRMKCNDPEAWKAPLWQEVEFQLDEPHLYRYSYESKDGTTFVAKAHADLDCDGQEAVYVMTGTGGANGPTVMIEPPSTAD